MSTIKLVAADPARAPSVLYHQGAVYRPDRDGAFEVDEAHVNELRPHGLVTRGERDARDAAAAKTVPLEQRLADLEARVAALEGRKAKA
ncbi:MAG TPA: hypothetical protein VMU87_01015 [Stellaceae bacterium]|nr:hypothetical protein [Stellaceae bacterium]